MQLVPTYEAQVETFASGKALFTFDSTAALPAYQQGGTIPFELALLAPPSVDGEPVTLARGGNIAIFRSHSEVQDLAWDFLRFLTSTEVNYRWAEALGAYPVRSSALAKMEAQWSNDAALQQAAEWLPRCRPEPLLAELPEIEQLFAQAMINAINGRETPEEALAEAARRTEGILKP